MFAGIFPSRTLAWYMARMFLVRTFAVLAALVLVLQALDLLGESGKILAVPGNGQADILSYVSLRVPQIIARFLPFSVLLGTIITLATLNQNSEVISMKAAGLSAHQVLAPLLLAALGVALISFAFNDRVVSRATSALSRWQKVEYAQLPPGTGTLADVWVKDGTHLINAWTVIGTGKDARLQDVTIHSRDGGRLTAIVKAREGVQQGKSWVLKGVRKFDVATGVSMPMPDMAVGDGVTADQFTLATVEPDSMSFRALWKAIDDLQAAGRPTLSLRSVLWHKISGPLAAPRSPCGALRRAHDRAHPAADDGWRDSADLPEPTARAADQAAAHSHYLGTGPSPSAPRRHSPRDGQQECALD
jgi:lipopolysaccharide export system permease protein